MEPDHSATDEQSPYCLTRRRGSRNYEHVSRGWCLYLIVVDSNETFRLSRGLMAI